MGHPRVRIPNTPFTLFSICINEKRTKISKKQPGLTLFKNKAIAYLQKDEKEAGIAQKTFYAFSWSSHLVNSRKNFSQSVQASFSFFLRNNGFQTLIVGDECEHADHLTTATALKSSEILSKLYSSIVPSCYLIKAREHCFHVPRQWWVYFYWDCGIEI